MKIVTKKNIVKTLLFLLVGVIAGIVLLLCSFILPTGRIEENVKKSVPILMKETKYHNIIEGYDITKLDNYTDSIMLYNAMYNGREGIIDKSMYVYRYVIEEDDTVKALANHFTYESDEHKVSYGRYWHGYLVILKPLLLLFDYSNIRLLNSLLQPLLVVAVAVLMFKKKKEKYIIPYLVSILMLSPFTVMLSLQYSTVFYISNLSLIILLLIDDKLKCNNSYIFYFLIVGMVTSYFDFLTYPLATLGMPLIMYFILRDENDFKKNMKDFFFNTCMWSIGYIGMWISKFVIGSLLTGDNFFDSAIKSIEARTSFEAQDTNLTPLTVINKNIEIILNKPYLLLLLLASIYFIYKLIKYKTDINRTTFTRLLPYLLIVCIPFAWYTVASNHSYIHAFFTHRLLIVSVFAFLTGAMSIIEEERTSSNENKERSKERIKRGKANSRQ